jgi:signal transduction histidine kinase
VSRVAGGVASFAMLDDQRLRRILDIGRSVVAELDLESLLRRVLDEARALTGARYAALGVLDDQRVGLERFLTAGIDEPTRRQIGDLPRGRGVLGVLIRDPRPLRLRRVGDHPRSYGFPVGHPPMEAFLGVPIAVGGAAFGNLYLCEKASGAPFDEDDEEAIVLLAGWASVAIANARAYHGEHTRRSELEQLVRALEATTEIARAVGGETDLERVLELIVKRARALVEARGVLIMLRSHDELYVAAIAGDLAEGLLDVRIPLEGSVSGEVMATQRVERLVNVRDRLRFQLGQQLQASTGLFVPLVYRGEPLGVLSAFDRAGGEEFTREDERLLESFAASAATAVATAQSVASEGLRRSIEASERERQRWARELHDETLQELAGLRMLLNGARRSEDLAVVRRTLDTALEQLDTEVTGLRRMITDLRPAALDAFGIASALEALIQRVTSTSGLDIELDTSLPEAERLPAEVEDTVYRLVQETLTNVVKHAEARRVAIALSAREGTVELEIADDGRGFDPAAATGGFGLIGMRERVALAGGTFQLDTAPGAGTRVAVTVPIARGTPGRRAPGRLSGGAAEA